MNQFHEHADRLLKKALGDQYVYQQLKDDPDAPLWSLGFHAEQAVEKSIKAVLTSKSIEYPRTHNIAMLLELCSQNEIDLPPDSNKLPELTPFGVALRYDDVIIEEIPMDRNEVSRWIESTSNWAKNILSSAT